MPATSWQLNGNDASTLPHSCQQLSMPATSWQLNGNDASTLSHNCQQWPMLATFWQLNGTDASTLPHSCQQWPMPATSWQLNGNEASTLPHSCQQWPMWQLCGNFVATDIAFGNVKQSLPKCCHAIAGIYIAGSDKFHSNGMCAIAGNKMAMTRPMGRMPYWFWS